jgi:hypothetical protein
MRDLEPISNCLDCVNLKVAVLTYKSPLSYSIYRKLDTEQRHSLCFGGALRVIFCTKKDILLVMPSVCKYADC